MHIMFHRFIIVNTTLYMKFGSGSNENPLYLLTYFKHILHVLQK